MKGTIKKHKITKLLLFALAWIFGGAIFASAGLAHATNTSLIGNKTVLEKVGAPANVNEYSPAVWTQFNKITSTSDGGYILVGRESICASDFRCYKRPAMIKYMPDGNGGWQVAWHKVLGDVEGEFFDASSYVFTSYDDDTEFILVVGQINNQGVVHVYNNNGDLKDSYTSDTESVYKFITAPYMPNSHDSFFVSDEQTTYYFVDKEGTTGDHITKSGGEKYPSLGEDVLYLGEIIDDPVVVTTHHIMVSSISGSLNVEGDFVAGASYRSGSDVVAITSDNKVQVYNYFGRGQVQYETQLPSYIKPIDITYKNDTVFVRGRSTKRCDLGGFINGEDIVYKIQNGNIIYAKMLPYKYRGNVPYSDRLHSDILATSSTEVILSQNLLGSAVDQPSQNTTWYVEGDNYEVNFEFVSTDNPTIGKCDINNEDSDTATTSIGPGEGFTPQNLTAEGYTFNGWYTDPELTNKVNGRFYPTSDTTLYGRWDHNVYDVQFSWNYDIHPSGANLPATQHIAHGSTATEPQVRTYEGYIWGGWHLDGCSGSEYNFSTPVTKRLYIVGCWTKEQRTVSFETTDNPPTIKPDHVLDDKTIYYEDTFTLPDPKASGKNSDAYTFNGWFTDPEYSTPYGQPGQQSQPVTTNMTLYGKWINHMAVVKDGEDGLEVVYADDASGIDTIYIDEDGNIVLDDFNGYGVDIQTDQEVTIVLEGDNNVSHTIKSDGPLNITGNEDSSLVAQGSITAAGEINIENADVTTDGGIVSMDQTTGQYGDIIIKDSTVDASESFMGILANNLTIDNSDVNSDAISTVSDLKIENGSTVSTEVLDAWFESAGDVIVDDSALTVGIAAQTNSNMDLDIKNGSTVAIGGLDSGDSNKYMLGDIVVDDSTLTIGDDENPNTKVIKELNAKSLTTKNDGEFTLKSQIEGDEYRNHPISALKLNGDLNIDSGSVNIESTTSGIDAKMATIGGDLNIDADGLYGIMADYFNPTKDAGKVNISADGIGISAYVNQIDGGEINATASACGMEAKPFAIFNNGTVNLSSDFVALCAFDMGSGEGVNPIDATTIENVIHDANEAGVKVEEDKYLVFNDGDIKLSGTNAAAIVSAELLDASKKIERGQGIDLTTMVAEFKEKASIDRGLTTIDGRTIKSDGAFNGYVTTFATVELDFNDESTMAKIIKNVHIHRIKVPNTDNPNTLDYQIIGLAGVVFIAVMVQGMIIADLYRRLHGYEEEIATEADGGNAMIDNKPVEQAKTEEQPAEEVDIKFEKHDKTDDYSGPGDEYYY